MRILTFTSCYLPGYKGGGPIKTIKNLLDATGNELFEYRLITSDRDLGDSEPYSTVRVGEWNLIGNSQALYIEQGVAGLRQLRKIVKSGDYDIIYLNSFFSFRYSIFPRILARVYKKKVVLGPRGEFSSGALKLKGLKKNIFIALYKFFNLHRDVVFQASSEYEESDIICALGNNVDIKVAEDIGAKDFAKIPSTRNDEICRIIFVSRISPKKNLLQAINILKLVKSPTSYDIYGPIEDEEYWLKCKSAIKKLPSNIKVTHRGSLEPDQVVEKMAQYDMFFMPTCGENYGHVIAEALCAGLPVLIADTTPWRQLQDKGIGWDLPLDSTERFALVIEEFASMNDTDYVRMRENVLEWAKHKFSQRDAIEANIAMFKYASSK